MRIVLRHIYYQLRHFRDVLIGENYAVLRRLQKAGRVTMGEFSYGIPRIKHYAYDDTTLTVGKYCSLSHEATIMLGGQHASRAVTTYPHRINWGMPGAGTDGFPTRTGNTVLGSDIWLCEGARIMSGVTVGHGAIIATNALVTKDVPDYAIVGGVPARIIGYRHSEEHRKALLEIRWWDWPVEEVKAAVPYLASEDIDAFIAYARERGRSSSAAPAATDQSSRRTRTT